MADSFKFPAVYTEGTDGPATVTAFRADSDKPVYMADANHPHFVAILDGLRRGDEGVWDLFDVAGGVMRQFKQVTDRVSWDGENVLFDGDPIHSVLADQLSRALQQGNPDVYVALAKFWEKLESNPSAHSREQAYEFLATHAFQITPEGDVVGYKGVTENNDGTYASTATSQAIGKPSAYVNGKPLAERQRVVQRIGDTVTMPRSEVVHDPSLSCERGLHVATYDYAAGYGTVLEVHVNPRDIVSVPNDAGGAKVRVCRYVVAGLADAPDESAPVLRDETKATVWAGDVGYSV